MLRTSRGFILTLTLTLLALLATTSPHTPAIAGALALPSPRGGGGGGSGGGSGGGGGGGSHRSKKKPSTLSSSASSSSLASPSATHTASDSSSAAAAAASKRRAAIIAGVVAGNVAMVLIFAAVAWFVMVKVPARNRRAAEVDAAARAGRFEPARVSGRTGGGGGRSSGRGLRFFSIFTRKTKDGESGSGGKWDKAGRGASAAGGWDTAYKRDGNGEEEGAGLLGVHGDAGKRASAYSHSSYSGMEEPAPAYVP